ncbi:hypothetical protein [Persephonella sp.]
MKIYSLNVSGSRNKGITVETGGNLLRFVSFEKKAGSVYGSIFFPDLIYATATLPPVEDRQTLNFLIRNRISGLLEEGKDYSFLIFPKEKATETEYLYEIYAVPVDVFYQFVQTAGENPENIMLFTVDVFSLIPVSKRIQPEKPVFHFYGDEEKVVMTVSERSIPLYSRSLPKPDYIQTEDIANFFYENFNLTYTFALQNKRIDIETVVVSGKASENKEFIDLVENFTGKKAVIPHAENFIQGLSQSDFMEFFIPVSTALLSEKFDFTPVLLKKSRLFNRYSKKGAVLFLLISALILIGTMMKYAEFQKLQEEVTALHSDIQNRVNSLSRIFSSDEIQYFTQLLFQKNRADSSSPLVALNEVLPLLEILNEKSVSITNENKIQTIRITAEEAFSSLSQFVMFREKFEGSLQKLKNLSPQVRLDVDETNYRLSVEVEIKRSTE